MKELVDVFAEMQRINVFDNTFWISLFTFPGDIGLLEISRPNYCIIDLFKVTCPHPTSTEES